MKALVRFGIAATAASLAFAPAQLAAQEAAAPAPETDSAIGPAQLRDFNLGGTVIRRSDPPPQSSDPAPPRQPVPAPAASTQRSEPAPARTQPARQPVERDTSSQAEPPAEAAQAQAPQSSILDFPPPTPATRSALPAQPDPASADLAPALGPPQPLADNSGLSPLPWLFVILLLGAGAVYYFRRQRSALALAGADASEFVAAGPMPEPRAQPEPEPRQEPQTAPAPPPPSAPVGIVSTRLRPELDIRFTPARLAIEESRVTLEFEVLVVNSGSGPARDVLLEAAMFTAGPAQEREIDAFYQRPRGEGERVPVIEPLNSLAFRSTVNLPRDQVRQFRAGDRNVFIPLIGFNLLYRSSGAEAQTSTSYLVGVDTRGERLAPFRLDQGPRLFADLAARELDLRLRK